MGGGGPAEKEKRGAGSFRPRPKYRIPAGISLSLGFYVNPFGGRGTKALQISFLISKCQESSLTLYFAHSPSPGVAGFLRRRHGPHLAPKLLRRPRNPGPLTWVMPPLPGPELLASAGKDPATPHRSRCFGCFVAYRLTKPHRPEYSASISQDFIRLGGFLTISPALVRK